MNMFKPVNANSADEYLSVMPQERRSDIEKLHKLIRKTAPELKPWFAYNMLGYGRFKYINYKKETVDWPIISLASQKNYISIYVCALENGEYIAEKYKNELGKVSVGKSCIRIKKLEDINLQSLQKIIHKAAKNPGLSTLNKRS